MAKLIFGLSQSLDGYVDHLEMPPGAALFRHFVGHVRDLAGSVYGRRTYEIMRYWDEDLPEWEYQVLGDRPGKMLLLGYCNSNATAPVNCNDG